MNRKYTTNEFLDLINSIRNKSNLSSFTTDYIVGYPTETNESFNESIKLLEKIKFLDMHIFPFSKRKGTKAAYLESNNIRNQKKDLLILSSMRNKIKKVVLSNYIGKNVTVLFETKDKDEPFYTGYSSEYLKVYIKNDINISNTFQKVKIKDIFLDGLVGSLK